MLHRGSDCFRGHSQAGSFLFNLLPPRKHAKLHRGSHYLTCFAALVRLSEVMTITLWPRKHGTRRICPSRQSPYSFSGLRDSLDHFSAFTRSERSHSFTMPPSIPLPVAVASVFPSGEKATQFTEPICPERVASSLPVAASQSLAVLSTLPEAMDLRCGLGLHPNRAGAACHAFAALVRLSEFTRIALWPRKHGTPRSLDGNP
jgi:hypothetical protein